MKKRIFCVFWAILLISCFTCAVAETIEVGSVTFTLPEDFELYEDESDSLIYTNQYGDIIMASLMDSQPEGSAVYENTGNLIHFINYLRDNSMPTAEIIAVDECVALYSSTDHASILIFNRYDIISLHVSSHSDERQEHLVDEILHNTVAKETPLYKSELTYSSYDNADFTLEADWKDFRFFLPSTFKAIPDSTEYYVAAYDEPFPYVKIESEPSIPFPIDELNDDRELLRGFLEYAATIDLDFEIIQMDECFGLMHCWQADDDSYWALVYATNRKDACEFSVTSDSQDEARDLAHAIIDHAVAKEIPLEALTQAE